MQSMQASMNIYYDTSDDTWAFFFFFMCLPTFTIAGSLTPAASLLCFQAFVFCATMPQNNGNWTLQDLQVHNLCLLVT
jgi:hypothetical protein